MGAIVIRTRYDEGTESTEVATNDIHMYLARTSNLYFDDMMMIFILSETRSLILIFLNH
jgi:hypothetical protein